MKILFVCLVWPEPTSSAAGIRTYQLIKESKHLGHQVEVVSGCMDNKFREDIESLSIKTTQIGANDSLFDRYISEYQPDLVFFDRFMIEEQFSWRVKQNCPDAIRILDTIDLHFLRKQRQISCLKEEILNDKNLNSETIRELAAIYRSDLSLIISDYEVKFLKDSFDINENLACLLRPYYQLSKDSESGFNDRNNFVTIGNFNHPPNMDSVNILKESIWQKIKDNLKSHNIHNPEIHIYGAYPSASALKLDDPKNGFRVFGHTEDAISTISKYRVNLNPIRFGAGIKGKILDGWCAGTPSITTSIGSEGLCDKYNFGGLIEDNWDDFADAAVKLYTDQILWEQAKSDGFSTIENLFSYDCFSKGLETVLSSKEKITELRNKNIIGQILWYNQFRSTEFFSRWIESKNKSA